MEAGSSGGQWGGRLFVSMTVPRGFPVGSCIIDQVVFAGNSQMISKFVPSLRKVEMMIPVA